MLAFWVFAAVAVAIVDRLRESNRTTLILSHSFKLYALRDDLREAAAAGAVNPRSWLFAYLDSSISKTIAVLRQLSILRAWASTTSADDPRAERAEQLLRSELMKPRNAALAEFHDRYVIEVCTYLLRRHRVIYSTMRLVRGTERLRQRIKARLKVLSRALTEAPETSTLYEFMPRSAQSRIRMTGSIAHER